jgi:hypothetical protein
MLTTMQINERCGSRAVFWEGAIDQRVLHGRAWRVDRERSGMSSSAVFFAKCRPKLEDLNGRHRGEAFGRRPFKPADGTLDPKDVRGFEVNLALARQDIKVILSEPWFV